MRIVDVQTFHVSLSTRESLRLVAGTRKRATSIVVRVLTDEGVEGIGESPGPYLRATKALIDHELRPLVVGQDPLQIESIDEKMDAIVRWDRNAVYATSGIDMALHDILGKTTHSPLSRIFGGEYRREIPLSGFLFIGSPEQNAKEAADLVQQGYSEIKALVGCDPSEDIARIRAIREAVGDQAAIRIDATQLWSVKRTMATMRRMERYDIQLVEQPIPAWDLKGLAQIRRFIETPVAADESVWTVRDALNLYEAEAADIFVIRIEEAGGMLKCKELADFASSVGIPCIMGSWAELGVSTAARLQVIASSKNFPFRNDSHYMLQTEDVICGGLLSISNGNMAVPEKPGLGVTLDHAKLGLQSGEIPTKGDS